MRNGKRLPSSSVLLLLFLFTACALRIVYVQADRVRQIGRYSAEDVLRKVEQLLQRIAPDAGQLMLTPTLEVLRDPPELNLATFRAAQESQARRFWIVTCSGANGQHLAEFEWDADSGRLCSVMNTGGILGRPGAPVENARTAAAIAAAWRDRLGMCVEPSAIQLTEYIGASWIIRWRGDTERTTIKLKARTGELHLVSSYTP